MVTVTDAGSPGITDDGRVPRATLNDSSSVSSSAVVVIVPAPVVLPAAIMMLDSGP